MIQVKAVQFVQGGKNIHIKGLAFVMGSKKFNIGGVNIITTATPNGSPPYVDPEEQNRLFIVDEAKWG